MRFILLSLVILASFCNAYEDRVRTKSAPAKDTTNEGNYRGNQVILVNIY